MRGGIKAVHVADDVRGVYAMPVLPSYFASHQWLRELRRRSPTPLVAIDFVIPDEEEVRAGHYARPHVALSAGEAVRVIMDADDPRGYEVLIPRTIEPGEIRRTRHVPQVVGWRYWPDAHGRPPCPCELCLRGAYGASKLKED